jgi:hypothetical protein
MPPGNDIWFKLNPIPQDGYGAWQASDAAQTSMAARHCRENSCLAPIRLQRRLAQDGVGPGRKGLRLAALALPRIEIAKDAQGLPEVTVQTPDPY